jgi:hypothetical protein
MLLDVIALSTKEDYKLILTFENGEIKEFDCQTLLNEKPFQALANKAFFRQAKIVYGTVAWNDDLDIAPETLYLDSKPIK